MNDVHSVRFTFPDHEGSGAPMLMPCLRQYAPLCTYLSAQPFKPARSSADSGRFTLAGAPSTIEPAGICVPGVTSAPAPINDCSPIIAPSRTVAPLPTSTSSPTLQACNLPASPTATQSPTMPGSSSPGSTPAPPGLFV